MNINGNSSPCTQGGEDIGGGGSGGGNGITNPYTGDLVIFGSVTADAPITQALQLTTKDYVDNSTPANAIVNDNTLLQTMIGPLKIDDNNYEVDDTIDNSASNVGTSGLLSWGFQFTNAETITITHFKVWINQWVSSATLKKMRIFTDSGVLVCEASVDKLTPINGWYETEVGPFVIPVGTYISLCYYDGSGQDKYDSNTRTYSQYLTVNNYVQGGASNGDPTFATNRQPGTRGMMGQFRFYVGSDAYLESKRIIITGDLIMKDTEGGTSFSVIDGDMKVRNTIKSVNFDDDAYMGINSSSNLFNFTWSSSDQPQNNGDFLNFKQNDGFNDGRLILSSPNVTNGELIINSPNLTLESTNLLIDSDVAVSGDINCGIQTIATTTTRGAFNATANSNLYEDDYIILKWDGNNNQPRFEVKIGSTGYWDASYEVIKADDAIYANSDILTAVVNNYYFTGGTTADNAYGGVSFSTRFNCFLHKENGDKPSYEITIKTGSINGPAVYLLNIIKPSGLVFTERTIPSIAPSLRVSNKTRIIQMEGQILSLLNRLNELTNS